MKVKTWGTWGSLPVPSPDKALFGGNTTCVEVKSVCLPSDHGLLVDAGSGIRPAVIEMIKRGCKVYHILHTHWHYDHIQGFLLCALPYVPALKVFLSGPADQGRGPRWVYDNVMRPPFHPVPLKAKIGNHLFFKGFELPRCEVQVFHPKGGQKWLKLENFDKLVATGKHVPFRNGETHPLGECLVVKMMKTEHPEQTVSYRFEEGPTGQVFVFVTDHEAQVDVSADFRSHLWGADLLIEDCQYTEEQHKNGMAGFGHGTPRYVAMAATEAKVKIVGITHHDPDSTDVQIMSMREQLVTALKGLNREIPSFACRDRLEIDIGLELRENNP